MKEKLIKYLPVQFMGGFAIAILLYDPNNKLLPIGMLILSVLIVFFTFLKSKQQEQ